MTDIARIARKTAQHKANLEAVKAAVPAEFTAETMGDFAVKVALAEGSYMAWARLTNLVEYNVANDIQVTAEAVTNIAFDMLSNGADDSWSGRGNDIKRARFDGLRSACADMKWL